MCCKSKKKPVTQSATQPIPPNTGATVYASTSKSKIPTSTVHFGANDFESSPLTNQQNFLITQKVVTNSADRSDRLQDYANQTNAAKESRLLQPKQLLTYDLDKGDGVSKTPVINTFHYESQLNHCFLKQYSADQINNRNTVYQNQPVTNSTYVNDSRYLSQQQQQPVKESFFNRTSSRLEKSGQGSILKDERNSSFNRNAHETSGVYQPNTSRLSGNQYAVA